MTQQHDAGRRQGPPVEDPSALLRLSATLRALRDEIRELELDDGAMQRLTEVHATLLDAICETLAPHLQDELSRLHVELGDAPSQATVRLVQSQLLGWIEGLFIGLQASLARPGGTPSADEVADPRDDPGGRQDPRYL